MTLLEIEAFLAVVKYSNLSTAAQNLFITQPALTRRIQIMEQELGYPLFIRRKGQREAQLTDQGAEFYHIAWKWQRLWEETNSITVNKSRESLAIASVDTLNHNLFTDLFPEFIKLGYLLRLYNAFSEDAYQYMERGIYDLAFITLQDYTQPLPARTQIRPATQKPLWWPPTGSCRMKMGSLPRNVWKRRRKFMWRGTRNSKPGMRIILTNRYRLMCIWSTRPWPRTCCGTITGPSPLIPQESIFAGRALTSTS